MSKLILVTGGAGFVGSHLCERLVKEGNKVISLDNYFTGSVDNHVPGVEYREGHTKDIHRHVPETPDLVFHLGEYSRVEQSFGDIDKVSDFNIAGTAAVLEFARLHKSKLVYAGSSTKFASYNPSDVLSPYAYTKSLNTELVQWYGKWFGLEYVVTYFYNVYGGRERSDTGTGTLVAIFLEKQKKGMPLTVRLPGTQRRNFTHVDDIIDGLVMAGLNGQGDGYGIGHPDSYSILEVAKMFGGEIVMLEERPGNRVSAPVNTDKIIKEFAWKPKHSLPEYIRSVKAEVDK